MSFRLKLIFTIVLLIAITFSLGGSILIYTSFDTMLQAETDRVLDSFKNVLGTLGLVASSNETIESGELGQIAKQMTMQDQDSWQSVTLDLDGTTAFEAGIPFPDVSFSDEDIEGQCAYVHRQTGEIHTLVAESRVKAGDHRLTLRGQFDLSAVYALHESQKKLYVVIYGSVLLLGIVAAVLLSYGLTGRLRKLTGAVRKIAEGDLTTRSGICSQDEFGQLSRDFDSMTQKLQETVEDLEDNIERQESFMGDFAHELKTPMTSIIGFADLLRQGNLDENTRMMAAEYIYTEGHRLERLSFKLLDLLLLKNEKVTMKTVNLQSFVGEVDKAMGPGLRNKGIQLVCRCSAGEWMMELDLMKSLLYNLIDNASKAIEKDGIIVVKADQAENKCVFQVMDNGRGMESDQLGRITEAFYRVDKARSRAQGGAGLGLALCKQIVELHKGSIWFGSVPGKGTIVKVTLLGGEANGEV